MDADYIESLFLRETSHLKLSESPYSIFMKELSPIHPQLSSPLFKQQLSLQHKLYFLINIHIKSFVL